MKSSVVLAIGLLAGAGSAWSFQMAVARSSPAPSPTPAPAAGTPGPAADRKTYTDPVDGFTIDVPRFPGSGPASPKIAAQFCGTPEEGYASTAQVAIQPAKTTRDDYRRLSTVQFRQLKATIIADRDRTVSGRDAIEFEYETVVRGNPLHFLALAVIDADRVVLVTCSASPATFPAVEDEFRASLASFKLRADPL